jgi:ABC-type nitrate/sulfonate/bicarbonate transport system substrate-binding protein
MVGHKDISRRTFGKLGLAALGGSTAAAIAPRAFAEGATQQVNIVTTSGSASRVLNELMKRLGYLQQFGIAPNLVTVADGAKAMGALVSGASDICVGTGFGQVLAAAEKGGKLKVLAGAALLPLAALFSSKPEIKTVKDLEGKTVGGGSVGSLENQLVTALFKKKGVDVSKVTFVNVGGTTDIFRAVTAGTIDAGTGTVDIFEQQDKYGVHALSDGMLWTELPEFTNQGSYCADSAIEAKRDALVRTLAAYAKLYRYISSPASKDDFVSAQTEALGKAAPEEALGQWNFIQKYQPYAVDLVLSEERIRYMQELNVSAGTQKTIVPFSQVADMSLARDALKLLG